MAFHFPCVIDRRADNGGIKGVLLVFFAATPPRHRIGVGHVQTQVAERPKFSTRGAFFLLVSPKLLEINTKEVGIRFAGARGNLVRWRLGHDQERHQQEQNHDGPGQIHRGSTEQHKRFRNQPAQYPAGCGKFSEASVSRRWSAQSQMRHAAHRDQQQGQPDGHPTIAINTGRIAKKPDGKRDQDDREGEREAPHSATDGVGVEIQGPGLVVVKPFDDNSYYRKQHEGEGNPISAVFFREWFRGKHAESCADNGSNCEPSGFQCRGPARFLGGHHLVSGGALGR